MTDPASAQTERPGAYVPRMIRGLERLAPRVGPDGKEIGDRAAMAALRRGLGKAPGEAPEMFPVLLPLLPQEGLSRRDEWVAYLVASLFALHPLSWPEAAGERGRHDLGASLRRLAEQTDSEGPERRLVALLNSEPDDLPHHLRGIISLLRAAKTPVPVDWVQLAWDLRRWDDRERTVQRRWATSFWGGRRDEASNAGKTA